MRILLTGANGQLGFELVSTLAPLGQVRAFDRKSLDLADPDALVSACRAEKPDLIVNAAAYTAVDKAESEPDLARAINADAPGVLAEEARRSGALLVHYSTDYVFDGKGTVPYTEEDATNPINVYGRSKLEGEQAIANVGCRNLVFRTSWVYGPRGRNFLATMLALARTRDELRVVDDQCGAPTTSLFLAQATVRAIAKAELSQVPFGIYNLTASGLTTWAGFAKAIFARAGSRLDLRAPRIVPIPSSEYPTPARRPAFSGLSNRKFRMTFGIDPPTWEEQLDGCLARMKRD